MSKVSFLDAPLLIDHEEELSLSESHHLLHVLRTKLKEKIKIVNGQGERAEAELIGIHKGLAQVRLLSVTRASPPFSKIILAQALPRLNRLEFIVEKGTELGMDALWLFPGERSEKETLTPHQRERLEHILVAALKQCGRLFLPTCLFQPPLSQWSPPSGTLYFGDLDPQAPSLLHTRHPLQENTFFFIGPESGFSEKEIDLLKQWGAQGVSLHTNILRTDTAPLVALSFLSALRHTT